LEASRLTTEYAIVKYFLLSQEPLGKANNAERYSAEATTGTKEILRPSHSLSVEADVSVREPSHAMGVAGHQNVQGWNSRGVA